LESRRPSPETLDQRQFNTDDKTVKLNDNQERELSNFWERPHTPVWESPGIRFLKRNNLIKQKCQDKHGFWIWEITDEGKKHVEKYFVKV
jgi:hypothetical protein